MKFDLELGVSRSSRFRLEARVTCDTEALGLVGPSGSGKSTFLDAVGGIESGGRVVLDGIDCSGIPLERRGIGYVTQDALLFPHLSVRSNLTYSPRAQDPGPVTRALGIDHLLDRMPRNLSGGERRRVALARAILARPRLLLLDEPFGGLDDVLRREAMAVLGRVRRTFQIPMILVSHLADEVIGLTDWAIRLEAGRVVGSGPSASLLRSRDTRIDNTFTGTVLGPGRVQVGSHELTVLLPDEVRGDVLLACYAHDILLALEAPRGLSARNVFPVRISSVTPVGDAALVELEAPPLRVLVTGEARDTLDIRPGTSKIAILKATSITYLGPA
jgi:molybdate transport system ATP-binding protein